MASNMTFGANIIPKSSSEATLGNSDNRWPIYSNKFNQLITGSGTAGKDNGSSDTSTRYQPAKWTFNTGLTASNGDIFTIKIPVAGHNYGTYLSIDNGTNYYPVVLNGTSRLTTQYGVNTYLSIIFESTGSAASIYPLNGGMSNGTVSNGVWRVINYRDNDTVPSAQCATASTTAAKTATCTDYALLNKSFLHVNVKYANTSTSKLTLNINSKGAKDIYINGSISSSTNFTLPAGSYLVYYADNKYYFRTDGKLTASITGDAATVNGKTVGVNVPSNAVFTDTTYSNATQSLAGLMSASDKIKLDGIAAGAQANSITGVKGDAETNYRTGNVNLTSANIGAVSKSGGTMVGNLIIEKKGSDSSITFKSSPSSTTPMTTSLEIGNFSGPDSTRRQGIYSYSYFPNDTSISEDAKWLIYRDTTGDVVVNGSAIDNVAKSGDTMTGRLILNYSKPVVQLTNSDTGIAMELGNYSSDNNNTSDYGKHGLWSSGFKSLTGNYVSAGKYLIYRDSSGEVYVNGNATTATTTTKILDAGNNSSELTISYHNTEISATDWIPMFDNNGNLKPVSSINLANKIKDKASGTWNITTSGNIIKTGDTMTGNLSIVKDASSAIISVKDTAKGHELQLGSWHDGTQGLWSIGYWNNSQYVEDSKWLICRDTTGKLLTSSLYIQDSIQAILEIKNSTNNASIQFGSWNTGNQGLWSNGYWDGSNYVANEKWLIYRNKDGKVIIPEYSNLSYQDKNIGDITLSSSGYLDLRSFIPTGITPIAALILDFRQTNNSINITANGYWAFGVPNSNITNVTIRYYYFK